MAVDADTYLDPSFWRELCPWLHVQGESGDVQPPITLDADRVAAMRDSLIDMGFLRVGAGRLWATTHRRWATGRAGIKGLARGILRLVEYGFRPSCILAYDEAWLVQHAIASVVGAVSNPANVPIGDFYAFCVLGNSSAKTGETNISEPTTAKGWPPHRDRVIGSREGVEASFRRPSSGRSAGASRDDSDGSEDSEDSGGDSTSCATTGTSRYITAWVALTDATPENSCLYFVPREHDPGYAAGDNSWGSPTDAVFQNDPSSYQHIVAMPAKRGTLLCFSHRVLHWGSRPLRGMQQPRVALSFAFADPSFESPYLRDPNDSATDACSAASDDGTGVSEGGSSDNNTTDDKKSALSFRFPAHGTRIALMAAQAIRYIANEPLDQETLDTFWEVFERNKGAFSETYVHNVSTKANWARFKHKQQENIQAVDTVGGDGTDIDLIFAAFEASKQGMSAADYAS